MGRERDIRRAKNTYRWQTCAIRYPSETEDGGCQVTAVAVRAVSVTSE